MVSALSVGHEAFLFICLRSVTAGVRPFLLAMQHFYSFVSQSCTAGVCTAGVRPFCWPCSISIHLSPRSVAAGVQQFYSSPRSVTGGVRPWTLAM